MRSLFALLFLLAAAGANAQTGSVCSENLFGRITCDYQTLVVGSPSREVRYQLPAGSAPVGGWPVVLLFHGTGGLISWAAPASSTGALTFGNYYQVQALRDLLAAGYAVLAPPATSVSTAWQTNNTSACPASGCTQNKGPTAEQYLGTADDQFFQALFSVIDASQAGSGFGAKLDGSRLYAAGISSGGYNSSRMAINYASRFRALAVQSASYANCSGPGCAVPTLPSDHPPTLFLHGAGDDIVPLSTMLPYAALLGGKAYAVVDYSRGTKLLGDTRCDADSQANCKVGHQWIQMAPVEILNWFNGHP
ncbi:MAG: plasmid partitioning protein [Nevskiaceae bacterium]|jgi:poly(3-hydroxybutyrate) depolymerase|nr:MAG: plasmid partitioning protein [Nevskiaceae bacterium]TAM33307.1 MAG: plasmid partitioning protein [Nevskiaceae bacterium]